MLIRICLCELKESRMKVEELKRFLGRNEIKAKFYEFSGSTSSVENSARQLEVGPRRIIKSLVFKDEDSNPLLAIISGVKRVNREKLSKVYGSRVRMAKAREVESYTGYKIGEVPPVNHDLETFIDSEVADFDTVIAGGGSTHTLVELDPQDIIRVTDAVLTDIS